MPTPLVLPAGLPRARAQALADLVAELTGAAPHIPPLAPAMLLSDPALRGVLALPQAPQGRLLIHDYQGLDVAPPFPLDQALQASATVEGTEFAFRLSDFDDRPLAMLRTGLRIVPAAEVVAARGMALRDMPIAWRAEVTVGAAAIGRYLTLAGDTNPLHRDPDYVRAAGLPAPPVPGMLLLSLFDPGCRALAGDAAVTALTARFAAPVYRDAPIALTLIRRGPGATGGARLRGFVLAGDGTAAAVADFTLGGAPRL